MESEVEENVCDLVAEFVDVTAQECLGYIEFLFGLDPGSLTTAVVRIRMTFTKAAAKGAIHPLLTGFDPGQTSIQRWIIGRMLLNAIKLTDFIQK